MSGVRTTRTARWRWPLLLATAAVLAGFGWRRFRSPNELAGAARDFNVLLITLDTTRADCLGCYGHPAVKTPFIDGLAREGTRFTQCTAAAPITLPSHASILTGTYPFVHGARNNGRMVTDEQNTTLAEHLNSAGYATAAEVGAYVLDASWGLDQGFDSYRSQKARAERRARVSQAPEEQSAAGDDVCDRALEWLAGHGAKRFFLWVHFFDPHQPCEPPDRFRRQYDDPYLGEIAFVDEQIGRLMAELKRQGLERRTLVALTADHGEGRMEHQELTHTYFVYDSTLHVPLIWHCPGLIPSGRRIDDQVSTVDIYPTILGLMGISSAPDVQGASLLPAIAGRATNLGLAAYAESVSAHESHGYARLRALRAGGWKYIHAPAPELYDIGSDPAEMINLAGRHPQRVSEMRERLENMIAKAGAAESDPEREVQLDADAAARLAALGYIGGHVESSSVDEITSFRNFEGPDPKDHVAAYNAYMTARAWAAAKEPAKAEAILRQQASAEPRNPAVRDLLAAQLRLLGRLEESAAEYLALLELQPKDARARYTLGVVLGELERFDESVAELRQAVAAMPEYPEAHAYLALGLAKLDQKAEAAEHFRAALALDPANEAACMGLGELLAAENRWTEAVQLLRNGLKEAPESIKLANNLAWYLATAPAADARDGAEAVRLAESVVQRLGQEDPNILDTMGAAYAEAGRFDEAVRTTRQAVGLAEARQLTALAEELRSRLKRYEAGQAHRS